MDSRGNFSIELKADISPIYIHKIAIGPIEMLKRNDKIFVSDSFCSEICMVSHEYFVKRDRCENCIYGETAVRLKVGNSVRVRSCPATVWGVLSW